MIEGVVNADLEAVVALSVESPSGTKRNIVAVIDTGYNGLLTLPPAIVEELELPFQTTWRATLSNGSEDVFDVHNATVRWDGHPLNIPIEAADTDPLVGMALLEGHNLNVDVHPAGQVRIEPIQAA
ncbi:MAG: clan AA aspartic protease [Acidimicrobiaceae bacterium]|nr:clan AA aspartic protease [Acidimicrobiaceae bacterium]